MKSKLRDILREINTLDSIYQVRGIDKQLHKKLFDEQLYTVKSLLQNLNYTVSIDNYLQPEDDFQEMCFYMYVLLSVRNDLQKVLDELHRITDA